MYRINFDRIAFTLLYSLLLLTIASEFIFTDHFVSESHHGLSAEHKAKLPLHLPERPGETIQKHLQFCFRREGKRETKECVDIEFPLES